MKRYLWFGYGIYDAGGGALDAKVDAETLEELGQIVATWNGTHADGWEYSIPKCNDVLDMQERRWLSKDEVKSIGL